eukprot:TRINITY_DN16491_c0_g1_i1.p1 TRINITY_DN16491_c0_g1~~TRINITY_DN16491_c0_g1_i1.p1  ORF type:complete len:1037 (+),score=302.47 TRINITY_DN16491_c0_g1_i1:39-3113(+)
MAGEEAKAGVIARVLELLDDDTGAAALFCLTEKPQHYDMLQRLLDRPAAFRAYATKLCVNDEPAVKEGSAAAEGSRRASVASLSDAELEDRWEAATWRARKARGAEEPRPAQDGDRRGAWLSYAATAAPPPEPLLPAAPAGIPQPTSAAQPFPQPAPTAAPQPAPTVAPQPAPAAPQPAPAVAPAPPPDGVPSHPPLFDFVAPAPAPAPAPPPPPVPNWTDVPTPAAPCFSMGPSSRAKDKLAALRRASLNRSSQLFDAMPPAQPPQQRFPAAVPCAAPAAGAEVGADADAALEMRRARHAAWRSRTGGPAGLGPQRREQEPAAAQHQMPSAGSPRAASEPSSCGAEVGSEAERPEPPPPDDPPPATAPAPTPASSRTAAAATAAQPPPAAATQPAPAATSQPATQPPPAAAATQPLPAAAWPPFKVATAVPPPQFVPAAAPPAAAAGSVPAAPSAAAAGPAPQDAAPTPSARADSPMHEAVPQRKVFRVRKDGVRPEAMRRLKVEGDRAYEVHDYPLAIEKWTAALALPDDGSARREVIWGNRSAAHFMVRRYQACIEDCRAALCADAQNVKLWQRQAKAYAFCGSLSGGAQVLVSASATVPAESAAAKEIAGELLVLRETQRRVEEAAELYGQATPDHRLQALLQKPWPKESALWPQPLVATAMLQLQSRAYAQAEDTAAAAHGCLIGVLEAEPPEADTRNLRSALLQLAWTAAKVHVESLLGSFDSLTRVPAVVNRMLSETRRFGVSPVSVHLESRMSVSQQMLQKRKEGNAAFQAGSAQEAARAYTSALQRSEHVVERTAAWADLDKVLYANRAAAMMAQGSFQKAIADCTKAAELDPGYSSAIARRARCYLKIGDHDAAIRDYRTAIREDEQVGKDVRHLKEALQEAEDVRDRDEGDYYRLLGVDEGFSERQLKDRYRQLAREFHPDRQGDATDEQRAEATRKFQKIQQAYDVLQDPTARLRYDMGRASQDPTDDFGWPPDEPFDGWHGGGGRRRRNRRRKSRGGGNPAGGYGSRYGPW